MSKRLARRVRSRNLLIRLHSPRRLRPDPRRNAEKVSGSGNVAEVSRGRRTPRGVCAEPHLDIVQIGDGQTGRCKDQARIEPRPRGEHRRMEANTAAAFRNGILRSSREKGAGKGLALGGGHEDQDQREGRHPVSSQRTDRGLRTPGTLAEQEQEQVRRRGRGHMRPRDCDRAGRCA